MASLLQYGGILTPETSIGISSTSISDFDIQKAPGVSHFAAFCSGNYSNCLVLDRLGQLLLT